jgi:hypothetical protein
MNDEPLYACYRTWNEKNEVGFKSGGRTFDNGFTLSQIRALDRHITEIDFRVDGNNNRLLWAGPLNGNWPDDPDLPPHV